MAFFKVISLSISQMENESRMEIQPTQANDEVTNALIKRLEALGRRKNQFKLLEKQNRELRAKIEHIENKDSMEDEYWIEAAE